MPVFGYGRWWTVLSANWLHGSLLHISFNMMWVRDLAPVVADMYGPGRMVIIYTVAGVCGFLLSSIAMLPAATSFPERRGSHARRVSCRLRFAWCARVLRAANRKLVGAWRGHTVRVILGVMGIIMPGIDNFAHAGGFFGGYLISRFLDPLKPERIDHIVVALLCLAAVVLSIAASVITGLSLFPA